MLLAAAAISGCRTAQIAFPAGNEKSGFDKFDVKGRSGFSIFSGKFTIGTVTVDWTQGMESSTSKAKPFKIFGSNDETITVKKQEFTVKTSGAGIASFSGKLSTDAEMIIETKTSKKVTTTSTEIIRNALKGTFDSEGTVSEFFIEQKDQTNKGSFKGRDFNFIIESTNTIEGSSFGIYNTTTGYYIYENNSLCAVVDIMNNGAVYLSREIRKEKISAVYAAAAALLKYKDPAKRSF